MPSIINATTSTGLVSSADNSGSLQLATNNGTTAVTIDTSQNVGIGVTPSGNYMLQAGSSASAASRGFNLMNINGGGSGGDYPYIGYNFRTTASTGSYNYHLNDVASSINFTSGIIFNTAASGTAGNAITWSERMRIDSSGVLLVNDTSLLIANSLDKVQVGCSAPSGGIQYGMMVGGNGTGFTVNAMRFVNTYTPAVVGTITIGSSSTAYNTSSDYRLKENIAPMTGALAKVTALKPCTYKWKLDGSDGEGFIAHELAEVCPHAVSGEKDALNKDGDIEPQGIDTSFLVATLTAAIQELNAKVDAQALEIQALKGVA